MKENLARQYEPQNNLQREFQAKNEILRSHFSELNPEDYLGFIFPDRDELVVVFGSLKDKEGRVIEKGTITRVHKDDVWGLAWRSNAYIPYATFIKNYYHSKTLETVRAFVVDLDNVTSRNLNKLLRYGLNMLPKPTYLVNSGKGVHLVYVLSEPQPVKGYRWSVNALNTAIQEAYEVLGQLDKHPAMHPYRFPGFQTKINTVATVFKIGEPYSFEELMEVFKVSRRTQRKGRREKKKGQCKVLYLPNGKRAFFEWVLWKLFKNPPIPGRRHNSFFALGIIAYKCKREVPEWEAVEAVDMVYDDMERYNLHIGFTREEAHRAFEKGYNPKAVRVRWKYLCELLGWEYRPNKRNGRTREEHLKYLQKIRQVQKEEKEEHIKRLLARGYTKTEIAEMLGMSRRNLYKTYGHLFT
jgi:hypothetical protein